MQAARTIFWEVVAILFVAFAFTNWQPVRVLLWGELQLDTKLPVLLLFAFLIGLLPPLIFLNLARWRLRRKVSSLESSLESERRLRTTRLEGAATVEQPAADEPAASAPPAPAATPSESTSPA